MEKLAKACGLDPSELLDFTTDPVVLTEDRAKDGFQATPSKGTRKPAKRR